MNGKERFWGMQLKPYCMLMHLSQFSSIFVPGLGFLLPIVMWIAHKDTNEDIDEHGRIAINWIISFLIYSVICFLFAFSFPSLYLLLVLILINFFFAIVAAVKANSGKLWPYPLSIKFLPY
jgi:uncharacterized Tic20 family protein